MILITGAAGKTGRAVVKALRLDGSIQHLEPIRTLVRKPEQIRSMLDLGVDEVVVGDVRSPEILEKAFNGVRVVYHIPPNVHPEEIPIAGEMLKAAGSAGIERFVYHSVLHPQIETMPHHWQKMRVEELIFTSGIAFTILQPEVYMQNILGQWDVLLQQGVYSVPYATQTRLGMVDLENVGMAAAIVLTQPGHEGAIYELAGPDTLSQDEVAGILSQVLAIPIRAESTPREVWKSRALAAGMEEYQMTTLLKMFEYYERYGFYGNPKVLSHLLGKTPDDLNSFVRRQLKNIQA
jgi:NAD(P)H dehydrogenase (quinone)